MSISPQYKELFKLIAQNCSGLAEQILSENEKDDKSRQMYNDFNRLWVKINSDEELDKKDYASLLIGCSIVIKTIEAKIEGFTKAIEGYQDGLMPMLIEVNKAEDFAAKAESLFSSNA